MRGKSFTGCFVLLAMFDVFVFAGGAAGQTASSVPADQVVSAASSTTIVSAAKLAPRVAAEPPAKSATSYQNSWTQQDQPMSLGEAARRARAQKGAQQAKAVRIFDDENMPRAPVSAGEKAPDFSGSGGGGSSSGGKVTILDFWATWCGPCRHALPGLKQLQATYGASGVEVVSISEDENEGAWSSFVAQNGMNWTQRLDSNHQIMRQYGASALPTYVLIGRDGTVIQQYVGDDPDQPIAERMGPDIRKSLEGKS